jgi:hypothetical protein
LYQSTSRFRGKLLLLDQFQYLHPRQGDTASLNEVATVES